MSDKKQSDSLIMKISSVIVDKRNLFFFAFYSCCCFFDIFEKMGKGGK